MPARMPATKPPASTMHEDERRDAPANRAQPRRVRRAARSRVEQVEARSTASRAKISEREPEVRGEPELRDARIVDQAARTMYQPIAPCSPPSTKMPASFQP